ncbi:unnamed protein product [Ceratitis capitata]|uniref:(Mediterranean fruit fly) hypothetical protein n=1 Tax=Ceratitis capitata TaxID=7213 RepID=A0A811UAM8_CERCA|nr:unnamed protein product [Ceratitis capitata]
MKINSSKEKSLPTSWVEVAADGFKSGVYKLIWADLVPRLLIEPDDYALKILGNYTENEGDSFRYLMAAELSTFDRDLCDIRYCETDHKASWKRAICHFGSALIPSAENFAKKPCAQNNVYRLRKWKKTKRRK